MLYTNKEIYIFWLHTLNRLKVDLQTAVKFETIKPEKAYNLFLRKCRDRRHDYKAGYTYNPKNNMYQWEFNNED